MATKKKAKKAKTTAKKVIAKKAGAKKPAVKKAAVEGRSPRRVSFWQRASGPTHRRGIGSCR